jgi:hypothetical protein
MDAIERAKENRKGRSGPPGEVLGQLKKARAELILEAEQKKRKHIKADVTYSSEEVDPFREGGRCRTRKTEKTRGGASDKQIAFLINLGVSREKANSFNRPQASAVIEKLKQERCTLKIQRLLKKFGEDPSVNFAQAKVILDEIASNGWQPRRNQ